MANIYGRSALTGGATGALDALDGNILADLDIAVTVVLGSGVFFHILDADSGAAEDIPRVIAPDTNPGTKRWLLQPVTAHEIIEV